MWPPSGSPARSAGSRLTRDAAGSSSPSVVSESVWFITSASKPSASHARSRSGRRPRRRPSRPRAARAGEARARSRSRAPASPRSIRSTAPELLDDPGEHQPLTTPAAARGRACPRPSAPTRSPAAARRRRPARRRRRRASGRPAAEQQRGDEQAQLVDLAGVEERARELGAALEQQRGDPAAPELVERRAEPALAVAGDLDHLGAGVAQRGDARRVGARRRRRRSSGASSIERDQLRVERQPGGRVEDDPRRLARLRRRRRRARSAAGRRRARCRSRPRPRRPRRASGARGRGSRVPRSTSSRRSRSR